MGGRGDPVADWLADARAGSAESFGRVLDACRGYLLLIAQQELEPALQAKGGASDLVQETFLKAHRHFDRFHGTTEAELLAWLRRLLLNNLADFRRLYLEAAKRQAGRETPLADGSSDDLGDELAAPGPTPSGIVMGDEQAEAVTRALDRLPEEYRQVLVWRHHEGLPFEEIGRRLNRTADAARKLWARAVERMHDEWEPP